MLLFIAKNMLDSSYNIYYDTIQSELLLTIEELNAHNTKDEPKYQTHHQHITNGRDGFDQRVHHHLS